MRRKDLVTNASLKMKRMPEDIPVQTDEKVKEPSKIEELFEEGIATWLSNNLSTCFVGIDHLHDFKRRVVAIAHHPKTHRRKKSVDLNDVSSVDK